MAPYGWMALLLFAFGPGCASHPEPPPATPAPSSFRISGSVKFNLPPRLSLETGLPQSLDGKFHVEAHAEPVSVRPMSSHYDGHIQMNLTDRDGKANLANVDFRVDGTTSGSPSEALSETVQRILDAFLLTSKGIPTSTTRPVQPQPAGAEGN